MAAALLSNDAEIPFTSQYFETVASFDWRRHGAEELRQAYRERGFLFLRGLLDRDRVLALRRRYFEMFDPALLRPGTSPEDGLYSGHWPDGLPPHGTEGHPAYLLVRSASFQNFADSEELRSLSETLLDGPVVRLLRAPLRHFIKGRPCASRAHIDFTYLDGGREDVVTLWISIGDCPIEAGGLVYLEHSSDLDLDALRDAMPRDRGWDRRPITHDLKALSDRTGRRWQFADIRAGDVLLHSPFVVHASLNTMTDLMRVSVDIRYALAHGGVDARWANHWSANDGY